MVGLELFLNLVQAQSFFLIMFGFDNHVISVIIVILLSIFGFVGSLSSAPAQRSFTLVLIFGFVLWFVLSTLSF